MDSEIKIRWGWLKGIYLYAIIGAGGFGLGIILFPCFIKRTFGWPDQDPFAYGLD
jgi:hypothetical protein